MIGQAHGSLYDANSLFAKRTCNSLGLPQPLVVLGLPYSHTRCAIQIISDIAAVVDFVNRLGVEECLKNGQAS